MAHNNTKWLNELGNSTKLVKPWFNIIIYHISTKEFDLETVNTQAVEKIIEENNLAEHRFWIEELA
jgi:hypothetical protein